LGPASADTDIETQFEEDQAMENPESLKTAGYRCSFSADPFMITPKFPWGSGLRKGQGETCCV